MQVQIPPTEVGGLFRFNLQRAATICSIEELIKRLCRPDDLKHPPTFRGWDFKLHY